MVGPSSQQSLRILMRTQSTDYSTTRSSLDMESLFTCLAFAQHANFSSMTMSSCATFSNSDRLMLTKVSSGFGTAGFSGSSTAHACQAQNFDEISPRAASRHAIFVQGRGAVLTGRQTFNPINTRPNAHRTRLETHPRALIPSSAKPPL